MANVAWIGLGVMGYPMAGHVLRKGGHALTVYNRNAAKAEAWVKEYGSGQTAATPAVAARGADFVFSCVGNDDDLRAVTLGPDGAFQTMKPGAVFIDNTTTSAKVARELHAAAKAKGIGFLDCPVSGGQAGAQNGALTVMCGGDADVFQCAKPVIAHYARMVNLIGPSGSGQLTKMVNQIAIAGLAAGPIRSYPLRGAGRPRPHRGHGHDLEGRRAVLADGKPLEDHARPLIRLRLRGRLDAQGPRDLSRGSRRQWFQAAGHNTGRSILWRGAGRKWQPLGHVLAHHPSRRRPGPA